MPEIIDELKRLLGGAQNQRYVLRLYVTGTSALSSRAIANIKAICESRLEGRYQLEIVDLYQEPELARGQQILAAPTLVKQLPLPLRRLVGDLSNTRRVLLALGLEGLPEAPGAPAAETERTEVPSSTA